VSHLFQSIQLFNDTEPHSAPFNMAMDEILLRRLEKPVVRIYGWLRPAVSFGYFEKYGPIKALHSEREPVRRWTGGGVVLHGSDLTYSLLVPSGSPFLRLRTAESYYAVHERITRALNRLGVGVSMADADHLKISQACFENATRHDILHLGRKIAGAAQRRTKFGLLHQGSIQNIGLPAGFGESLAGEFSGEVVEIQISPCDVEEAWQLSESRYARADWTEKF